MRRRCRPACTACTSPSGAEIEVRLAAGSFAVDRGRPVDVPATHGPRFSRGRLRRGRLPHADRGSAAAAAAGARRSSRARDRSSATIEALLDHPRLVLLRFDGSPRRGVGRPRASRPADPVRARARAARDVGRVDADRRPAGRLRAAVRELRAGLGIDPRDARARHRVRHHHARGRHLVDRRSRARSAPSVRRAVSHSRQRRRPPSADAERTADGSSRSAPPSCARSSTPPRATGSCAPGTGVADQRVGPSQPAARRRCHPLRHARARQQPLPAAARVRGRRHAGRRRRRARGAAATGRTSSATRC